MLRNVGVKVQSQRCYVKCIGRTMQSLTKWCYSFLRTSTLLRNLTRGQTGTVYCRKEECAWLQGKEQGRKRSNGLRLWSTHENVMMSLQSSTASPLNTRQLSFSYPKWSLCVIPHFLGAQHGTKPNPQNSDHSYLELVWRGAPNTSCNSGAFWKFIPVGPVTQMSGLWHFSSYLWNTLSSHSCVVQINSLMFVKQLLTRAWMPQIRFQGHSSVTSQRIIWMGSVN